MKAEKSANKPARRAGKPRPERSKYRTLAEARRLADPDTMWRDPNWPQGLYCRVQCGGFRYRLTIGAKRTSFLKLTDGDKALTAGNPAHLKIARRLLREKQAAAANIRDNGVPEDARDYRYLGALGREYLRRAECSNRRNATLSAYKNNLARLTDNWIWGDFETFLATRLTKPFVLEVRDHLRKRAQFVAGRRVNVAAGKLTPQNAPHLKWRTGYSANCVNASMWASR